MLPASTVPCCAGCGGQLQTADVRALTMSCEVSVILWHKLLIVILTVHIVDNCAGPHAMLDDAGPHAILDAGPHAMLDD